MSKNIRYFSSKFKIFEDLIINFFIQNGHIRYQSPKSSKIIAFFQIFQNLTQTQACTLTGFSKGNISTTFSYLLKSRTLNAKMIPGTHTKIYSLNEKDLNVEYEYEKNIKRLKELIDSLDEIFGKLTRCKDLEGFDEIHNRIKNLIQFLNKQKEFTQDEYNCLKEGQIFNPSGELSQDIVFPSENIVRIEHKKDLTIIHPKIFEIERKVIEQIIKYNLVRLHDSTLNLVYSFFISRKYLSQILIRKLTGLSPTTVSRTIKTLLTGQFIEQKDFKLDGKRIYEIVPFNVPKYSYNKIYSQIRSTWKSKFVEMQQILQDPSNNLMESWEYPYVYTIIDRIIDKL